MSYGITENRNTQDVSTNSILNNFLAFDFKSTKGQFSHLGPLDFPLRYYVTEENKDDDNEAADSMRSSHNTGGFGVVFCGFK